MATTAKEYKDLNKATTLDKTAMFAVAQEGQEELQTITTEQLAQPIADVLSEGALAELEYATSQGKNAIATALTNKGVSTTASETLIQMADKVNNLNVDTGWEDIRGPHIAISSLPNYISSGASYPRIFRNPISGDTIFLRNSILYYIPDGKYDSFEAFLLAATHTLDLSTEDLSYTTDMQNGAFAVSEDFTKLLITVNDANLHQIYEVSSSTGFSKLKEFTKNLFPYNVNCRGVAISDDGNFVLYQQASTVLSMYNTTTNTDYTVTRISGGGNWLYRSIIKSSKIYVILGGNSTTDYFTGQIIPYEETDGAIEYGNIDTTQTYYESYQYADSMSWLHVPGQDDVPLLFISRRGTSVAPKPVMGDNHAFCKDTYASVWPMTTAAERVNINNYYVIAADTNRYTRIAMLTCGFKLTYTSTEFMIKFPLIKDPITINRTNGAITYPDNYSNYAMWTLGAELIPAKMICYSDNTITVTDNSRTSGDLVSNIIYEIPISTEFDKKIFAKKRTVNGLTSYYDPYLSYTDIYSGAYDVETTITPTVPDDEQ